MRKEEGRKERNERGKKSEFFSFIHEFINSIYTHLSLLFSASSFLSIQFNLFLPLKPCVLSLFCVSDTQSEFMDTKKREAREEWGRRDRKERKIEKSPTSHFDFIK